MDQIGVFLSYNHVDHQAASEVRRILTQISDRFAIFLDHASLGGGDEYESKIAEAIGNSSWFLFLALGDLSTKDMTWCFYEAGQFRAKLQAGAKLPRDQLTERMCVIYDGAVPPRPTTQYQSIKVSTKDSSGKPIELDRSKQTFSEIQLEATPIYRFLKMMVQKSGAEALRDVGDDMVLSLLRESARAIIQAVAQLGKDQRLPEVPLQPRISFSVPWCAEGLPGIDPETVVTGYDNALQSVFKIAGDTTSWAAFKDATKLPNKSIPLWLEDVEKAVCMQVAANLVPHQTDMVCVLQGNMFRPIITRFVPYQSGKRDVYIIFSPVQRRPLVGNRGGMFGAAEKIGLLLLSLIMAVRFRQRVLPLVDALESDSADTSALLLRIEREIGSIESEAQEYGFVISGDPLDVGHNNVIEVLSEPDDRKAARRFLEEYLPIRTEIVHNVQDVRDVRTATSARDVQPGVAAKLRRLKELILPYISLLVKELDRQEKELIATDGS
jgi:hypothetical protein